MNFEDTIQGKIEAEDDLVKIRIITNAVEESIKYTLDNGPVEAFDILSKNLVSTIAQCAAAKAIEVYMKEIGQL